MKRYIIFLIKCYQFFLSPWFGRQCRFTPTCSNFSIEAINQYGISRGFLLMAKRILSCHPLAKGGEDLVPKKFDMFVHMERLYKKCFQSWVLLAFLFRNFF